MERSCLRIDFTEAIGSKIKFDTYYLMRGQFFERYTKAGRATFSVSNRKARVRFLVSTLAFLFFRFHSGYILAKNICVLDA
jgi:hypothetical protein